MKKITILALVLVLCLGAIGIGYAHWYDDVEISGTVDTGSIDLQAKAGGPTYVYKDLTTHEMVWSPNQLGEGYYYVAGAWSQVLENGDVQITFDQIFPTCQKSFTATVLFDYFGTVPVVVEKTCSFAGSEWIESELEWQWSYRETKTDPWKTLVLAGGETIPTELYDGYNVRLQVKIQLDEINEQMDASGSFLCTVKAVQWACK